MKQRLLILRFLLTRGSRYSWQLLKNCIRLLLGRQPYFDEGMYFFWQYLLHLAGIRRISKITCAELTGSDGAGAQAHLIMDAISFAHASDLTYVHTPFSVIGHAERPLEQWAAAWEEFFNLGAGEPACEAPRRDVFNYSYAWRDLELCFGWHGRREQLTRSFKASVPDLRRKYYLNKSPRASDVVTVAVHIRRGDVNALLLDHFTETEVVLQTITAVKSILESHRIQHIIRVYSQGNVIDFIELSSLGIEFFLDADAVWTMQKLIEADILIMAQGSFSFCAGVLSNGIKIFEPLSVSLSEPNGVPSWGIPFVPPADDWLLRAEDGGIDQASFEQKLLRRLNSKPAQNSDPTTIRIQ